PQDVALEVAQHRARLEAELAESAARTLERVECILLRARAVAGEHQLSPAPLAQRLRGDQRFERAELFGRTAECELRVDPQLFCLEPQLLQPRDLLLGERLEREVGKRVAAP